MRTYIFFGLLAVLGNLQYVKATSTSQPDLIPVEEEGSGDIEDVFTDHVNPTNPSHAYYPPDEEVGSGMRPEGKGGGVPSDEDAEYDDEDYYDEDETEGSGGLYYPPHDGDEYRDVYKESEIVSPELPAKKETYEEILVENGLSFDFNQEHMPSTTPPPTLTDSHHDMENNNIRILTQKDDERQVSIFAQPSILAAFIGGAVMGLLCAILLVMFIVYRMRKRDEGSYPLDEPKRVPLTSSYSPNDKEIYA